MIIAQIVHTNRIRIVECEGFWPSCWIGYARDAQRIKIKLSVEIGVGNCCHERTRVVVDRVPEQCFARRYLDDLPSTHHGDPISHIVDDCQIM